MAVVANTLRRVNVPNTRFDKMVADRLRKLSGNVSEAYRQTSQGCVDTPHFTAMPTNSGMIYIRA